MPSNSHCSHQHHEFKSKNSKSKEGSDTDKAEKDASQTDLSCPYWYGVGQTCKVVNAGQETIEKYRKGLNCKSYLDGDFRDFEYVHPQTTSNANLQ